MITQKKKNIIMIITIVVLATMTAIMTTFMCIYMYRHKKVKTQLNNGYERAYYELLEDVNNIEVGLSKVMIASGKMQKQMLMNISSLAETACAHLCSMPLDVERVRELSGFINDVSGFTKSLHEGEELTDKQIEMLEKVHAATRAVSSELHSLSSFIGSGFSFSDGQLRPKMQNPLKDMMSGLKKQTIQYPELIYDGPFSTAKAKKEIKGLPDFELSRQQCEEKIREYFSGAEIESMLYNSEMSSGNISCYVYDIKISGINIYLQVTKKGGKLLMFDAYTSAVSIEMTSEQAQSAASNFLERLEMKNMKAVWYMESGNTAIINYAPVVEDVVYYPDLVKVKVNLQDGSILGIESQSYYSNHCERKLEKPNFNTKDIKYQISKKLEIQSERLALVPKENKEVLAYEITAVANGLTFFIYIDVKTGEEIDIFRVIDTEQGSLLI